MRKNALGPSMQLGPIIEHLGPLNNEWRFGSPPAKVMTLWDIGDVLLRAVPAPNDHLLWHIQEKSYITRTVLRYALIVRRGWPSRSDLERLTTGLRSFTIFREALPFLKGDRENIDDATHAQVINALHDLNHQRAIKYVQLLKKKQIGRQHHKGATIASIREDGTRFLSAVAALERQMAKEGWAAVAPVDTLVRSSQIAMGIASGETITSIQPFSATPGPVLDIGDSLVAATRNRAANTAFRKAVGAERLMQAADFLNGLRSEITYNEWRKRQETKLIFAGERL